MELWSRRLFEAVISKEARQHLVVHEVQGLVLRPSYDPWQSQGVPHKETAGRA